MINLLIIVKIIVIVIILKWWIAPLIMNGIRIVEWKGVGVQLDFRRPAWIWHVGDIVGVMVGSYVDRGAWGVAGTVVVYCEGIVWLETVLQDTVTRNEAKNFELHILKNFAKN